MKAVITGAAGFIGSSLSLMLYKLGWELLLIDNLSFGDLNNLTDNDISLTSMLEIVDITDCDKIKKLLDEFGECDYLFHFAGIAPLPDCQSNPVLAFKTNVTATINILEYYRIKGIKKIIISSTNAVYENNLSPYIESMDVNPTLIYSNTKKIIEMVAKSYYDLYGLPICCVRFSNVYGPRINYTRKQPPFIGYVIKNIFNQKDFFVFSDGNQRRDYIYIDDLLDLLVIITRSSIKFDIVNCSSGVDYSVNELIFMIKTMLNKKNIRVFYKDPKNYWDNYDNLFNATFPIDTNKLISEVEKATLTSNLKATIVYNWFPKISIKEGLEMTVKYYTDRILNI